MKNRKKEITLLITGILVIVSMITGATYAFFKAQIGQAANFDINATTSTTDNLTFSTDGDVVLNVTAENLKKSGNDLFQTAKAKARLIKSNTSESTTANYNIYLLIEENEMEYSSYKKENDTKIFMTKEEKEEAISGGELEGYTGVPELILSVKKGETEQEITKRLTSTTGGYDITEAEGLYAIGENVEIISNGDVTDTWEVTVTFKNLEYNQQLNTGRSLKGKIIITSEKLLYEINDANELRQLSTEVNAGDTKEGKYFVLTDNIDLEDHEEGISNFTPIGTESNPFLGNFNGDNHTISNLYINNTVDSSKIGLFGYLTDTSVSNLEVTGNVINKIKSTVGGIIGATDGVVYVKNLINKVNVTSEVNAWDAGGVIGANYGTVIIQNCRNYGNIEGSYNTGGLIGFNNANLTIENSVNNGEINNQIGVIVGGLVGLSNSSTGNVKITNSYNIGNITKTEKNGGVIGGLIGQCLSGLVIENSYNKGTLTFNPNGFDIGARIGGLVGYLGNEDLQAIFKNSYNSGNIYNGNTNGGLIGTSSMSVIIYKCYNSGTINIENETWFATQCVGGLIGTLNGWDFLHGSSIILNSYNSGDIIGNTITSDTSVGLLANIYSNEVLIINCYNVGNMHANSSKTSLTMGLISSSDSVSPKSVDKNLYCKNTLNNVYNLGSLDGDISYSIGDIGILNTNKVENTYYVSGTTSSNIEIGISKEITYMKSQSFVDELNNNIKLIDLEEIDPVLKDYTLVNWKLGNDGYPTLDF